MLGYGELVARSAALPYAMPTESNRISTLAAFADAIEADAAAVRPILHGSVPALLAAFLALKREAGSPVERALYADMSVVELVTRLLSKRPLAFLNPGDDHLLRSGARGSGGFDAVGTSDELDPLRLCDLLSYDEMALSALLGVSVPTRFINAGARGNRGAPGAPGSFEPRGVYVGLVGARFERRRRMEWRHMIVSAAQNTPERGYGPDRSPDRLLDLWARHYGLEHFPSFEEAQADAGARFVPLAEGELLDGLVYRERLRRSIEPFLLDANDRARAAGAKAYVHAVGLGLGVWSRHPRQNDLMLDVYADVLRRHRLEHVADVDFSWFRGAACGGVGHGEVFREGGNEVALHFSRRDPAAPLTGPDAGKLLVAMYAWDSNAYPGNEYWLGALSASGDPAAACCSTIPELQNPDVNPRVAGEYALPWTEPAAPATLARWKTSS